VNRLTAAYSTNEKGTGGFTASDRPPGDVLFRRARRHSRRVRLLRVVIPIIITAGLVVSILVVWLNPLRMLSELPVSIGRLTISGTKMTMTEPKLSGYTRDERRYELTANAAVQDATKVDVVNLEEPRANLEMSDGSTVSMRAALGVFDRKAGVLTLRRDVVVTSSSGYEMRLSQAVIDVRNGNIVSDQPVSVKMQQGTLQGNRFEVIKSGEIVRFDGGVTMTLAPPSVDPGNKKTMQP
jgi:lipopolysaccharide export system protein LptC